MRKTQDMLNEMEASEPQKVAQDMDKLLAGMSDDVAFAFVIGKASSMLLHMTDREEAEGMFATAVVTLAQASSRGGWS